MLRIAGEAGLVKRGHGSTDGTKVQGNASRPKAMSYGDMKKEGERWREELEVLGTQASQQDAEDDAALGSRRGDELPAELSRRDDRRATIEAAMRRVEARAKAEAEAEAERQCTGKKRRGRAPKEGDETPVDKAPMSFTDPELGIMQTNNKGWDYCGHAQASVDGADQISLACAVTAETNAKQQAVPRAQWTVAYLAQAAIERPNDTPGVVETIPATSARGYYRETAAEAVAQAGFDPSMATGRQRHHAPEDEVRAAPPPAKERMAAKGRTPEGHALYARRKVSVEPVFGQIKEARGCRRLLLRGLDNIRGEWTLVWLTPNLLKLWRYRGAPITV